MNLNKIHEKKQLFFIKILKTRQSTYPKVILANEMLVVELYLCST